MNRWNYVALISAGILIVFLAIFCCGCQVLTDEQGKKYIRVNPVVSETIETSLESGSTLAVALAPVIPYASPIAAALLGALAVWKKNKKTITTMQDKNDAIQTGSKVLTDFIDYIKVEHPDWWEKIRLMLDTKIKSTEGAQEIIKEIRNS